jgi:hypothetical protein
LFGCLRSGFFCCEWNRNGATQKKNQVENYSKQPINFSLAGIHSLEFSLETSLPNIPLCAKEGNEEFQVSS